MSKGVVFSDNCKVNGQKSKVNQMLKSGDVIESADGNDFSVTVLDNSTATLKEQTNARFHGMHDEAFISVDQEHWELLQINGNYDAKFIRTREMSGVVVKTKVPLTLD